jgi:Integral membrane protein DUF95.
LQKFKPAPKTAAARYAPNPLRYYGKRNRALLVLALLFLSGVLLGALLLRGTSGGLLALLSRMIGEQLELRAQRSMPQNFTASLASSGVFVGTLFLCGFCAVAHPAEGGMPLFQGMGVGMVSAYLYAQYQARAMGYIVVYLLPSTLLNAAAVMLCARESLRLSSFFWSCMHQRERGEQRYSVRLYLARYLAASVLCLAAALLESGAFYLFGGLSFLR